jgi:hypothetical protein
MADEHLSHPVRSISFIERSATMPEKSVYETGARKYPARTGPDPSDDFSQDAATNKPPGKDGGLAEKKGELHPDDEESSLERDHINPSPRDTREAPAPNPNGESSRNEKPAS